MKPSTSASVMDSAYLDLPSCGLEISHEYGTNVHILANPLLLTYLASLCAEKTIQPAINDLVCDLYQSLIQTVLNNELPRTTQTVRTRMAAVSHYGFWTGQVIDSQTAAVTVSMLRAGSLPSQVCFDRLNKTLNPALVRQDYVMVSRVTDSENHVIGSHLGDCKIGGSVANAFVFFPDPMGGTASSLVRLLDYYKNKVPGPAKAYIALNLIITPEYIKKVKSHHPDTIIYALRLDRGASPAHVLKEKPGVLWNEEIGLTDKQYIIPGAGGFGEIMNNSNC